MAEMQRTLVTKEGLENMQKELDELRSVKRAEVAQRLKEAIAMGDLSENSEYDEAKNEQAFVEGKIVQLENTLRNASVIDENDISSDVVGIGSRVTVYDYDFEEEVTYSIVGSTEADPMNFKISNESQVGNALLGHKVDDEVVAQVPNGMSKFKILEIGREQV